MKQLLASLLTVALLFAFTSCKDEESNPTDNTVITDNTGGLVGTWVSSGANVALLLRTYFKTDSIIATFNSSGSYTVLQYDSAQAVKTLTGSFTVTKGTRDSLGGTFYAITVNQTSPVALTAQGIYLVNKNATPNQLVYEVVQTGPTAAGIAPTLEAGFGSSKTVTGVSLGTMNIQKYVKR